MLGKLFQSPRDLFRIFTAVKSGDSEITFALRAETGPGRDHDVDFVEHSIEHFPAR